MFAQGRNTNGAVDKLSRARASSHDSIPRDTRRHNALLSFALSSSLIHSIAWRFYVLPSKSRSTRFAYLLTKSTVIPELRRKRKRRKIQQAAIQNFCPTSSPPRKGRAKDSVVRDAQLVSIEQGASYARLESSSIGVVSCMVYGRDRH